MQIIQNRRHFLAGITAISAVGLAGGRNAYAEDAPLDTTTVRFTHAPSTCNAPLYLAEELLRADGFTDLTYVDVDAGVNTPMNLASGEADIGFEYASAFVIAIDAGTPVKVLGGLHAGCYELFAREGITSVLGLKGKRIGVGQNLKSDAYLFVGAMAIHVGLDPLRDIDWVIDAEAKPMQLFIDGKVDAFLGFGTECQELRAKKIGHSIVSGVLDRPWSQYFCCMLAGSPEYVENYPIATKRVLRAHVHGCRSVHFEPGACGASHGRPGLCRELRICSPGAPGDPLQRLARIRSRGLDAILFAAAAEDHMINPAPRRSLATERIGASSTS